MHDPFDFEACPCSGKNLPRLLQPMIMALLTREKLHGYRIQELLEQQGMFRNQSPDMAGVYRVLRNMEQEGLVLCEWELQPTGAPRKQYAVTEKGKNCLVQWKQTLTEYRISVAAVIEQLESALRSSSAPADDGCESDSGCRSGFGE